MFHRDVIDQLLNNDGFADAGAAERADFSAFRKRTDEIDDFYSSFQNRSLHVLLGEIRCLAMNRIAFREFNRAAIVNRIARDVKEAAEHAFAHWHGDRPACVGHAHATLQPFGTRHRNCPYPIVTKMLLHLERHFCGHALNRTFTSESVVNSG